MNINISDNFYTVVEEYNKSIKNFNKEKLKNITLKELKGMVYTNFRRYFDSFKFWFAILTFVNVKPASVE